MEKFIGTKEVMAQPMNATEAVKKNYRVNSNEHKDGYEVEYEDGYKSWSPIDVFEKHYKHAETHEDRLKIEIDELNTRMKKLHDYRNSPDFVLHNETTRALLDVQYFDMLAYYEVLLDRYEKRECVGLSFGEAITLLKEGYVVKRDAWRNNTCVVKQIPAHITGDIVPKMTSLPESFKSLTLNSSTSIDYREQCLIFNKETGEANSWVPSMEDIFANDWELQISK